MPKMFIKGKVGVSVIFIKGAVGCQKYLLRGQLECQKYSLRGQLGCPKYLLTCSAPRRDGSRFEKGNGIHHRRLETRRVSFGAAP